MNPYGFTIPEGSPLDPRIEFKSDESSEEIAFDSFQVVPEPGERVASASPASFVVTARRSALSLVRLLLVGLQAAPPAEPTESSEAPKITMGNGKSNQILTDAATRNGATYVEDGKSSAAAAAAGSVARAGRREHRPCESGAR